METTHLNCNKLCFEGDHHSCGFSTQPPKNYPCSFCKRAFRSAQALGGHMNVHRRDRARLRQLPSWVLECPSPSPSPNPNPNPIPNPNPNFSSSSSPSTRSLPFSSYTHHSLLSPSLSSFSSDDQEKKTIIECTTWQDSSKKRSMRDVLGAGDDEKKGEKIRLDLEMNFLRDPKEDLDLELRLGCL